MPQTEMRYDTECQFYAKQMTLRPEQIGAIGSCIGRECVAALVVIGAVAAASVVVSGSIVVAGNIVYWVEKQGQCFRT